MRNEVHKKFKQFDPDDSDSMDVEELGALVKSILGYPMEAENLEAAIKEMDEDGEGSISWSEFELWFFKDEDAAKRKKEEEVLKAKQQKVKAADAARKKIVQHQQQQQANDMKESKGDPAPALSPSSTGSGETEASYPTWSEGVWCPEVS